MIESRVIEFKADERWFIPLFRDLMKGGSPGSSVQDVFMAFCPAEACWLLFAERTRSKVDNLDEFRSETIQSAVKFANSLS